MDVSAKITGIKYHPLLCRDLKVYSFDDLAIALAKDSTFILGIDSKKQMAISWWRSPKRTRSYPYARVYDTLGFQGKRVTIIPLMKDEGIEGDRDFLQWDTISLMSLLGVYTIISYFDDAIPSKRYRHKITKQIYSIQHIEREINNITSYQSDALHWNMTQIDNISNVCKNAMESYEQISKKLGIKMHSKKSAEKRINEITKSKENFMNLSRGLAKKAQQRERITTQPKEYLKGKKCTLTITNYLGGNYFFTCDEVILTANRIILVEAKHSAYGMLPSLIDIKDGLVKMILFTNLKEVTVEDVGHLPVSILKLTGKHKFGKKNLSKAKLNVLNLLCQEAAENNFQVMINKKPIEDIGL